MDTSFEIFGLFILCLYIAIRCGFGFWADRRVGMARYRFPEGDDWKDHAVSCPNCEKPVMDEREHFVSGTMIDPGWWKCDPAADQ